MKVLPVPAASVEQDAIPAGGDGLQHALDGDVLVARPLEIAASIFKGVAKNWSRQTFCSTNVWFQSSSGVGKLESSLSVRSCISTP